MWSFVFRSKDKVLVWIAMNRETREIVASSNIALWVKKQGKRLILSVGIIPYGIQLARFLRKTLSFSKCVKIHEIFLKLFIHRYNTELLPIVG